MKWRKLTIGTLVSAKPGIAFALLSSLVASSSALDPVAIMIPVPKETLAFAPTPGKILTYMQRLATYLGMIMRMAAVGPQQMQSHAHL